MGKKRNKRKRQATTRRLGGRRIASSPEFIDQLRTVERKQHATATHKNKKVQAILDKHTDKGGWQTHTQKEEEATLQDTVNIVEFLTSAEYPNIKKLTDTLGAIDEKPKPQEGEVYEMLDEYWDLRRQATLFQTKHAVTAEKFLHTFFGGTNTQEGDPCSNCDGKLVLRNGAYGDFFGCSRYPKCTYTRNPS